MSGRRFPITGGACILFALMLLVLPLKWIVAVFFAAAVHELSHAGAVLLCGGRIIKFEIGIYGAVMTVTSMTHGKEVVCALAGPLAGLLFMLVAKWFPRTAICGVIQSAYNLIPIYPLDGGRAVYSAMCGLLPPKSASKVYDVVRKATAFSFFVGFILLAVIWNLGIAPILLGCILLMRLKFGKIPCNISL